jgi:hypothetical protein
VFKYLMIRRPGQQPLSSKVLMFGGSSAPKNFTMESRALQVQKAVHLISNVVCCHLLCNSIVICPTSVLISFA